MQKLSRREFFQLTGSAASGLALGCALPTTLLATGSDAQAGSSRMDLHAYVALDAHGRASIYAPIAEMGQGVFSSLPMLVAEEMDLDWELVDIRLPFASEAFVNPLAGDQYAAESRSIRGMYPHLRQLGAALRQMLITAAADRWRVPPAEIETLRGRLRHDPSGREAGYGEFAAAASALPVPADAPLKPPQAFALIGKSLPRKDVPSKVNGTAIFGVDADFPGAKRAAVRHCSMAGGTIEDFRVPDDLVARHPGLLGVYRAGANAIAAVAEDFWTASRAVAEVELSESGPRDYDDERELARLLSALDEPGRIALNRGEIAEPFNEDHAFVYTAPLLAHATLEPQCAAAWVQADRALLKVPTQGPRRAQARVAQALGLAQQQVHVEQVFLGGGFGRRAEDDYAVQAALVSRAAGVPVRLQWSREEDTRHDFYRPAYAARFRVRLGEDGLPQALSATIAGHSLLAERAPAVVARMADPTAINGLVQQAYSIPAARTSFVERKSALPQGFWRAVANSMNCFFGESCIDELAHAAAVDPAEYRLRLLPPESRAFAVMRRAMELADWGNTEPDLFQGLALCEAYGSVIVQVVELARRGGALRVNRIVSALDCGIAVDPQTVEAQIEGGAIYGLTAALYGRITVRAGVVQQGNFHDQPLLAMAECPRFVTSILPSDAAPGGVGEIGTPAIAPALANALFAATGRRSRQLPVSLSG